MLVWAGSVDMQGERSAASRDAKRRSRLVELDPDPRLKDIDASYVLVALYLYICEFRRVEPAPLAPS
jgi:hypothetical protein